MFAPILCCNKFFGRYLLANHALCLSKITSSGKRKPYRFHVCVMTKTRRQNLPANITSKLQKVESLKDQLQQKKFRHRHQRFGKNVLTQDNS